MRVRYYRLYNVDYTMPKSELWKDSVHTSTILAMDQDEARKVATGSTTVNVESVTPISPEFETPFDAARWLEKLATEALDYSPGSLRSRLLPYRHSIKIWAAFIAGFLLALFLYAIASEQVRYQELGDAYERLLQRSQK